MDADQSEVDLGSVSVPLLERFQKAPVLPRICLAPARAMYIGPGLQLAPHLNVATTIAVALDAPFELKTWGRSTAWSNWRSQLSALIPSETLHHLKSCGPMAFLYLDPLTDQRHPMSASQLACGRNRLLEVGQGWGVTEAFAAFGLHSQGVNDQRIAKVVLEIERRPDAFNRMQDAADMACLSPSRFRARFDAEVGLPFRRYRLWRRMALVMRCIAAGESLTTAALLAGFASSAHLSSAFKRMFGLSASDILALGVAIDLSEDAPLQSACVTS